MKLALASILGILLSAAALLANGDVVNPGVYLSSGNYSGQRHSTEYSAYGSVGIRNRHFISAGYSDLAISDVDWKYRQKVGTVGALFTRLPFAAKAYYSRVSGDYASKLWDYSYSDHANVISAELIYVRWPLTLGMEYARFDGSGYSRQRTDQYTLRHDLQLQSAIRLSVRPSYVWVMDGPLSQADFSGSTENFKGPRHLASIAGKLVWQAAPRLRISAGGFLGQRAYYFDNDLLVLNNQNETQTGMRFAQIEALVWRDVTALGEYIQTDFDEYSIEYVVIGIKSQFKL
jgi:hypothetical protein